MELLAISATKATLEFIDKGGIFMYPLVLCSITGLVVTALRKGECALSLDVEVDTMDPTYRSRQALYFITVN